MNTRLFFLLLMLVLSQSPAQPAFTRAELLQGYRDTAGTATFIFDETVYNIHPARVMVEGSMRAWRHDMEDTAWRLVKRGRGVWTLDVANTDYSIVKQGDAFKFRVDEGRWIDPPQGAPNVTSGNLTFAHHAAALVLHAEIVSPRHVRLLMEQGSGGLSLDPADYRILDAADRVWPVDAVLWIAHGEVLVRPADSLDITRVWYLNDIRHNRKLLCSFDGWYRCLYSSKQLGANYDRTGKCTMFRIFAPRAGSVKLYIYPDRTATDPSRTIIMLRDGDGVWEAVVPGNLEGQWYDFTVHGNADDPGNEFFETVPKHITDPYARVSDDSFGRARVWRHTAPAAPLENGIPRMEDVVAYEVHVEDFTSLLPGLDARKRGTLTGFFEPGLRNTHGAPAGIDHLSRLGVNVVHLLPVQEYLNYPDAEWRAAFANDPYMKSQGIDSSNYDWGYRTSHAFAVETRYRERGTDYGGQLQQFSDLVQAFHDRGIAVIVDFVFNHTAERIDSRDMYFNFRVLDRPYYYRTGGRVEFLGDYGTETKSEDRPMTARWIIDQCKYFIDEFGVDGFRIDLAGLTDKQTLRELRRRIGPDKILYGEPWIASSDPRYEANPDFNWYKADAPITFFQDDTRNALCGPTDPPRDKRSDRGYAGGNGRRNAAKQAIANLFADEHTPNDGINYLDIHDNWTLADKFAARGWNGSLGVDEGPYRIAAAMLLTSLGPIVIHGGSEFMRSKGAAPDSTITKHTASGPIYINGRRDTYNLRAPNLFHWENLGTNRSGGAACNYQLMADYWRGLISLRKSDAGSVCRIGSKPPDGYIKWIEPADSMQLGYVIGGRMFVLVNTATYSARVKNIKLPAGEWKLVVDGYEAGTDPISGKPESVLKGGQTVSIDMLPESVRIWIRK
jgi:pullulanase/glycogen debranching enzyme